ncbi:MAG: hypothetical protein B0W54_09415 [Cellvibrio sp. 79]|nr:MAG: hypothetical protein B0W54_09415 [Cellvibrio sp. 79]
MDNVTPLPPPSHPCVIKLDQLQFAFYQQSKIEIQSPEGMCLARIGEEINRQRDEDLHFQLLEQVGLLEVLFEQVNDDIKLPARAVTGLADLMSRVNEFLMKR